MPDLRKNGFLTAVGRSCEGCRYWSELANVIIGGRVTIAVCDRHYPTGFRAKRCSEYDDSGLPLDMVEILLEPEPETLFD